MVRSVLNISSRNNNDNLSQKKLIDDIKEASIAHNLENDITGVLVVGKSHFLHILEGSDPKISDLILNIEADKRHQDSSVVFDTYYANRLFSDWRIIESHCHDTSLGFNQLLMHNADELVMIEEQKFDAIEKIVVEILH